MTTSLAQQLVLTKPEWRGCETFVEYDSAVLLAPLFIVFDAFIVCFANVIVIFGVFAAIVFLVFERHCFFLCFFSSGLL